MPPTAPSVRRAMLATARRDRAPCTRRAGSLRPSASAARKSGSKSGESPPATYLGAWANPTLDAPNRDPRRPRGHYSRAEAIPAAGSSPALRHSNCTAVAGGDRDGQEASDKEIRQKESGITRADRHRHGQAVCPTRRWWSVQGIRRCRAIVSGRPPQESKGEGQAGTRRQGRPLNVCLLLESIGLPRFRRD